MLMTNLPMPCRFSQISSCLLAESPSSTSLTLTRAATFPSDNWGTSLEKAPLFTRAEMDRHITETWEKHCWREPPHFANRPQKSQNIPRGRIFTRHRDKLRCTILFFRAKCFHSFRRNENPHQLRLTLCLVMALMCSAPYA